MNEKNYWCENRNTEENSKVCFHKPLFPFREITKTVSVWKVTDHLPRPAMDWIYQLDGEIPFFCHLPKQVWLMLTTIYEDRTELEMETELSCDRKPIVRWDQAVPLV